MSEMLSLRTIEKVTSEVLQSLEYRDDDIDIDWVNI